MRSEIRRALLIGVVFGVLLNSVNWIFEYLVPGYLPELSRWFWLLWPFVGGFLLGAVPAYLFFRYRVAVPLVLSSLISAVVALVSLQQELAALDSKYASLMVGWPLFYYLVFCAVPLVVILVGLGIVEHRLSTVEPDEAPA